MPYWVRKGFTVTVNGTAQNLTATAGSYVTLSRQWASGDTVQISMPFSLRMERTLDQPQTQCIAYGPVPLVVQSSSTSYLQLSFYQNFTLSGDLSHAITPASTPMTFTTNGHTRVPFYNDDPNPYHVYFHRGEPEIIFGTVDAGVANPQRSDGLSFLDVLRAQAPFASQSAFQQAVTSVAARFVQAGLPTTAQQQKVVNAASAAHLAP